MSGEFLISWHGATNLLQCKCILSIDNYQKVIIHKNTLNIGEFDLLEFADVWGLLFSHDSNHGKIKFYNYPTLSFCIWPFPG
jgi:hypothetical protein